LDLVISRVTGWGVVGAGEHGAEKEEPKRKQTKKELILISAPLVEVNQAN